MSQAGSLTGLENIQAGLKLRVKPFLIGGLGHRNSETENLSDVGIEDLKFRVTPSLTADFTLNTDFAQTDVDDLVVNTTRFTLFFPEKREFFLEGAGIFEFGTGSGALGRRDLTLFFSRRDLVFRQMENLSQLLVEPNSQGSYVNSLWGL